jgi:hypothetical protein
MIVHKASLINGAVATIIEHPTVKLPFLNHVKGTNNTTSEIQKNIFILYIGVDLLVIRINDESCKYY